MAKRKRKNAEAVDQAAREEAKTGGEHQDNGEGQREAAADGGVPAGSGVAENEGAAEEATSARDIAAGANGEGVDLHNDFADAFAYGIAGVDYGREVGKQPEDAPDPAILMSRMDIVVAASAAVVGVMGGNSEPIPGFMAVSAVDFYQRYPDAPAAAIVMHWKRSLRAKLPEYQALPARMRLAFDVMRLVILECLRADREHKTAVLEDERIAKARARSAEASELAEIYADQPGQISGFATPRD